VGAQDKLNATRYHDEMAHDALKGRQRTTPRCRVLFVSTASRPGGAECSLELLIRSLEAHGIASSLVRPDGGLSSALLANRHIKHFGTSVFEPVRHPSFGQAVRLVTRWIRGTIAIAWAIFLVRPQIVHANTTSAMLVAMLPAWLTRRPLIWHVRDMISLGYVGRLCGRLASAVVAISNAVQQNLLHQGVPAKKIHLVYNGVEASFGNLPLSDHARRHIRQEFGFSNDAFVYLNVGQFVAWKRQDLFLRAAAEVIKSNNDARFLIVGGQPTAGDPGCQSCLENLVKQLNLSRHAVIHGWRHDIGSVLAATDALVHATEIEPFGRIIIEAMQVGLPVIAVRGGGPKEIIEDGKSGLFATGQNTKDLASLMLRVQKHPELAKQLTENARRRVRDMFTAEHTTQSVVDLYHQVSC